MSINFNDDMNPEAQELIKEMFKDSLVDMDTKKALFDRREFTQQEMKKLANTAKQPVEMEINDMGEIKKMADGTEYALTKKGWRKLVHRVND